MNSDEKNKNQNLNDYSFILDQSTNDHQVTEKKSHKKVVILLTLVAITFAAMVLLIVTTAPRVQQDSASSGTTEYNEQAANDIIASFFQAAEQGNGSAVRATFVDDLPYDEEYFNDNVLPFLGKLQIDKCQPVENRKGVGVIDDRGFVINTYECPVKGSDNTIGMEFILKDNPGGDFQIFYYNLVAVDETN